MDDIASEYRPRRPRFRRAPEPPAFRLTDDDIEIVRHVARHRFLRSTHIAALVGRSIDRTNDRLLRLFHAGYLDRPRAQLDYYPTSGSAPLVYALADRGARLLIEHNGFEHANIELSQNNRRAGRPFIEHQLEIMDFYVGLECALRDREDVRLIHPRELIENFPKQPAAGAHPFKMQATLVRKGRRYDVAVIPDFVFGLRLSDGSKHHFVVEIDRGTMPVRRSGVFRQTSFEEKMRAYLLAHATSQHERQFGWKNFRVLTVTPNQQRMQTMMSALLDLQVRRGVRTSLIYFALRNPLRAATPLASAWQDGNGRPRTLW